MGEGQSPFKRTDFPGFIASDFVDEIRTTDDWSIWVKLVEHKSLEASEHIEAFVEATMGKEALYDANGNQRDSSALIKVWKSFREQRDGERERRRLEAQRGQREEQVDALQKAQKDDGNDCGDRNS